MITGVGAAVPSKILTNSDLEKMVDTSDEWIKERTGIEVRHIAEDEVQTSDLCAEATLKALKEAELQPEDIDLIILGTVTGDVCFPATACFVQEKIGATKAAAFDISAACSGFLYGLTLADSLIAAGKFENILVIGAEILSRVTDWEDRATCVLFGDGAGAAVVQPSDGQRGILGTYIKSDGRLTGLLILHGGGSRFPLSKVSEDSKLFYIKMQGREVFKAAVSAMGDAAVHLMQKLGLKGEDIDLLIPHQANIRIIKATANRTKVPMSRVYVNVDQYGNTSAASIPIALDEAKRKGKLNNGDTCLMVAFGSGFTWGSVAVRF